jgi:hypothetical protein
MKFLYILAICIGLTGCGLFPKKPDAVITEKVVRIDPEALKPCADLITVPLAEFETVLAVTIANAELYVDCRNKQNNSIKLLKEFANQKDSK